MRQLKGERLEQELKRLEAMEEYERKYRDFALICGVDEAGRGPLAGPVAAGACILPKDCRILYLNDSKKVSPARREELFLEIQEKAVAFGVGMASPARIDEINILQATYEAMGQAVAKLGVEPDIFFNDAVILPGIDESRQVKIIKGDAKSVSIAAASILAKVTRDHMMEEYGRLYPEYGFEKHKGYGTKAHLEAIREYGLCPIHRRSFLKKFQEREAREAAEESREREDGRNSREKSGGRGSRAMAAGRISREGADSESSRAMGSRYEELAAQLLAQRGYEILEKNFRSRTGEIDLVARDGDFLVFVEVKYRTGDGCGDPAEAVDEKKQRRIRNTARYYLSARGLREDTPCRFDVVAVLGREARLIQDAF